MKRFTHHSALSVNEAVKLLRTYDGKAKVNAGGTDLLGAMKDKSLPAYPEAVIDIKTVEGLDYIRSDNGGLRIGALATLADVAESEEVKADYGLLAQAVHSIASPNVRNMATVGGNLAQDVRCWYYRYPRQLGGPIVCLRKGGKVCSALGGDNRYHSLFGAAPLTTYPCSSHCPAGTDIPGYMDRIKKDDLAGAARILMDYNPLPAVTGRICPVFCEPECNRREFDAAVAIQCVERGMGDHVLEKARDYYVSPETETGRKIAVIGSGPAGLAAAFYLRRSGHAVTVFEKLPEAGGMLLYSIPSFRLPKDVVRRQIEALKGMGIIFETGVEIGKKTTLADLGHRFDAVLVAGGTWKSLKLNAEGEDADGVLYALDYLRRINSGERPALGKKVVVIGGGSVAIDAARTARRLGAEKVHVVCLECRDPNSKDRMLALDAEIREAEEEGIVIDVSLGVQRIVTEGGKVAGVETVTCLSVREPDGTFNPQYDRSCTAATIDADSLIIAIGQGVDPSLTVKADNSTFFVAGDMVSGPSTVIKAVASARQAAQEIDSVFNPVQSRPGQGQAARSLVDPTFTDASRPSIEELPAAVRLRGIDMEDVPGPSMEEVDVQARRCFNCGCLAVGPSDIGIALVALGARIATTKRTIKADDFFDASAVSSTVLEPDEIIKEIRVPKPPAGTRQKYEKFTLRKPIDFAIVSVASLMNVKDGVCKDARIVLGAVAPAPLRAYRAEKAVRGCRVDGKSASDAAEAAVADAMPLDMNGYKIKITRALVRRAIMGE